MTEADVCILIPTLNEEATIGSVVKGVKEEGFENVVVIDGGSTDNTRDVASAAGARVVEQTGTGKGQAIAEAVVEHTESEIFVMLDGDGTYEPEQVTNIYEPLSSGNAEHVIGDRFADMDSDAMKRLNRVGNGLINRLFSLLYGKNYRDILSGYRGFTRDAWDDMTMNIGSDGFGIETEMAVESVRQGVDTEVVGVSYSARPDGSETNLSPVKDGAVIFRTLYRLTRFSHPLLYFSIFALLSITSGIGIATYVLAEWVTKRVSHEVLALLAGLLFLFGVQILIFGILGDLIVKLHREQRTRLNRIEDEVE